MWSECSLHEAFRFRIVLNPKCLRAIEIFVCFKDNDLYAHMIYMISMYARMIYFVNNLGVPTHFSLELF